MDDITALLEMLYAYSTLHYTGAAQYEINKESFLLSLILFYFFSLLLLFLYVSQACVSAHLSSVGTDWGSRRPCGYLDLCTKPGEQEVGGTCIRAHLLSTAGCMTAGN